MKQFLFLFIFSLLTMQAFAQKVWTQNGHISFYSKTPLEDIEAENNSVSSVIDLESGKIAFSLLVSSFEFEKALMQEHFNEKYLHSDKFPKSTFKGKITNIGDIKAGKPGTYEANVEGDLTIHGETNPVKTTMTMTVKNANSIMGKFEFNVFLQDYNVEIPNIMKENISETILVKVNMNYAPLKK